MLKKSLLSVTALLAATMLSATAQASTVDLNYVSPNTTVTTSVSVNSSSLYTYMGSYNLSASNVAGTIIGFCVDPFQWAST